MKKYEIYLPLKYNDGQDIEPQKFKQIRQQLVAIFGAITVVHSMRLSKEHRQYGGVEFIDDVIRLEWVRAFNRYAALDSRYLQLWLEAELELVLIGDGCY